VPLTGPEAVRQHPVVSLLTDFGYAEPFAGLVKARVLAECPSAKIVDLTHSLPPYAIEAAAFWIGRAYRYFPPHSVHVCVVDPGVGTERRILLAELAGHVFLAPDNGLLTSIGSHPEARIRALDPGWLASAGLGRPSATFHGRDLFAPLAGRLAAGTALPEQVGQIVSDWQRLATTSPVRTASGVHGRVLFADTFGNIFSNIETITLVDYAEWEVVAAGRVLPWVRTYGEAAPGTVVALENSFGVVEIACVGGSAAGVTGLGPGAPVELRRRGDPERPGY